MLLILSLSGEEKKLFQKLKENLARKKEMEGERIKAVAGPWEANKKRAKGRKQEKNMLSD